MSTEIPPKIAFFGPRQLFRRLNERSLRDDLTFYFAIAVAASILWMIVSILAEPHPAEGLHLTGLFLPGIFISIFLGLMNGAIALLAVSLVEHFFLLFVDVHREFEQTMKSVAYALSPLILFSWAIALGVPFAGLLLAAGFCLLTYFGVRVFHEKSGDRAVFVALATAAVLAFYIHRAMGFG
ncbi:MAG: YIP1 family protein [Methanoculleus sp.]